MSWSTEQTRSFEIGPRGGFPCLLLHGFTGSPAELRPLADRLAAAGFRAMAPLLPGHGLGAADLLTAGASDWIEAARTALSTFDRPAYLVGNSMGALLALRLSLLDPGRTVALALLAPAARLTQPAAALAWLLWRAPWICRRFGALEVGSGSDLRDPTLVGANPKNHLVSLRGLADVRALQSTVFDEASALALPVLVCLGSLDRTIDGRAARRLARALSATVFVASRSGHQLALDRDREAVASAVIAHARRSTAERQDPVPPSGPP